MEVRTMNDLRRAIKKNLRLQVAINGKDDWEDAESIGQVKNYIHFGLPVRAITQEKEHRHVE